MFLQPIYFPLKLYRRECGPLSVRSDVQSPAFSSKSFKDVPYLDVSATLDNTQKTLSVAVVNRHQTEPLHATVAVQNARPGRQARAFEINGASPETENTFSEPENVKISQKEVSGVGEKFDYTFPAHSVTLLKLTLA
jgi:alpha-N-arabinofuranosidase